VNNFTPDEIEELWGAFWPRIAAVIGEAVERATSMQSTTAHAADIVSIDEAVALVAMPDNPSNPIPVTRATGAGPGDRCVVVFVPGGRAFALGSIPMSPNPSGAGAGEDPPEEEE
jgi:hypothetical protein